MHNKSRTILISGASRGIGKSIAEKALQKGHRLSLGMRNVDSIKGTSLDPAISGSERILINYYDALSPESGKAWIENTLNTYNGFDTLINCAGIFKKTKFNFSNEERKDLELLFETNLIGPWLLTKDAWSVISEDGNGRIVFLVSMSGKRSKSDLAGYTVSKFALMGLCQTIRNEGWGNGVRVTAICPGWVNTEMAKNVNSIKKKDMTQPEDIGSLVEHILRLPNSCVPFEVALNCNLEK